MTSANASNERLGEVISSSMKLPRKMDEAEEQREPFKGYGLEPGSFGCSTG